MKTIATTFFLLILQISNAQMQYENYFSGERLRFDYGIFGNAETSRLIEYNYYREPQWGGSVTNLIDTMRYGDFLIQVYDSVSNRLIFSRGYSTLFNEWKTIEEAKTKERLFLESVVMPFPVNTVKIVIFERDYEMQFAPIYNTYLNPAEKLIGKRKSPGDIENRTLVNSGSSSSKLDIVMLSEGYTADQKYKFFSDAEKFANKFFEWRPYNELSDKINIQAVFSASEEAGTDIPADSFWINTALNSHFSTFNIERYLTTEDMFGIRDLLADIPYDQICILVNTDRYGGGGFYNYLTVFTTGHPDSEFLFHHEFGHAFAALADEYFTSEVAYIDMFDLEKEPYQPNITTLIDFGSKWKSMLSDTVPVPTPNSPDYSGMVGVFEGAAYNAKGIYRPYYNCSMKSVVLDSFCPVCRKAIRNMVLFYSK